MTRDFAHLTLLTLSKGLRNLDENAGNQLFPENVKVH